MVWETYLGQTCWAALQMAVIMGLCHWGSRGPEGGLGGIDTGNQSIGITGLHINLGL